MQLVVWNMSYGNYQKKLDLLWEKAAPDMAVLLEIDDRDWEAPAGGMWEEHLDNHDRLRVQGIRIWHKTDITVKPLVSPDLSQISIARAYSVAPAAGGTFDFKPFVFVAYWAVTPRKKPFRGWNYQLGLYELLSRCQDLFSGDLLIAGDTNLTAEEAAVLREIDLPGISLDAELLHAFSDLKAGIVLGALKQPCDTLLHRGKWYPCDLGIATASMAERIGIIRAGDWRTWIKPVGEKTVGSDHLPIFITV